MNVSFPQIESTDQEVYCQSFRVDKEKHSLELPHTKVPVKLMMIKPNIGQVAEDIRL